MIKIICVGKIKENYLVEAIKEYQKRITKYTKLEIIEVPDENIKRYLTVKDYIISLEINGKQLSSIELSDLL